MAPFLVRNPPADVHEGLVLGSEQPPREPADKSAGRHRRPLGAGGKAAGRVVLRVVWRPGQGAHSPLDPRLVRECCPRPPASAVD